ncbi:MAG: hypothetical protein JXK94_06730 [Deltaproteobacteria bacterium]|nr:hypothetical protein [Deltaproteobacteria bacterium]
MDIILEAVRALMLGAVFFLMLLKWETPELSKIGGWNQLLWGFGLLFFGTVLDLTDNFHELSKWVIMGETPAQVFPEEVAGDILS